MVSCKHLDDTTSCGDCGKEYVLVEPGEIQQLREAFDEARVAITWAKERHFSADTNWVLMCGQWLEKFKKLRPLLRSQIE